MHNLEKLAEVGINLGINSLLGCKFSLKNEFCKSLTVKNCCIGLHFGGIHLIFGYMF